VADTLLPNVLTFTPGTVALWDPWRGIRNGKGLTEEASDNMIKMVINEDFTSGLKPGPLLDHFPLRLSAADHLIRSGGQRQ
jgi:hypothetical protein